MKPSDKVKPTTLGTTFHPIISVSYNVLFTPHSREYAAPDDQGAFPIWRLLNGWVSYATQDEVHVTIALRRIQNTSADRFRR